MDPLIKSQLLYQLSYTPAGRLIVGGRAIETYRSEPQDGKGARQASPDNQTASIITRRACPAGWG